VKIVPGRGPAVGIAVAALLVGATATPQAVATPPRAAAHAVVTSVTVVSAVPGMPRSYTLPLREQYQATNYYCVPATTSMSLSTFGVKIGQVALAKRMRTTIKGTGGDNAASVMDAFLHPRRFDDRIVGDVVGHPDLLMQRVSYDVGSLRRAPIIQVWMDKLPWNRGKLKDRWIGHAIIAYGYNQVAGTITVFDPWRPTGGAHTLPAKVLAGTLQNGAGMHYISRL
jgi:hypothetical protein